MLMLLLWKRKRDERDRPVMGRCDYIQSIETSLASPLGGDSPPCFIPACEEEPRETRPGIQGTRNQAWDPRNQEPGLGSQAWDPRNQEPGQRSKEPGLEPSCDKCSHCKSLLNTLQLKCQCRRVACMTVSAQEVWTGPWKQHTSAAVRWVGGGGAPGFGTSITLPHWGTPSSMISLKGCLLSLFSIQNAATAQCNKGQG